jgi:ABC-2 type transport system permease protein
MSTAIRSPRRAIVARTPPPWWRSLLALVVRGLRDSRRAPLTWGGALGAMSGLMAAIWPSIEDSMTDLVKNYPSGLKEAFGIQQLDTVERYVDAEMLSLIVPLALAFFAVRCATRATVGAEERGYLDTLLSAPVSRQVLVAASLVVTGLVLAAILGVMWALTWVAGTVAGSGISAPLLARGVVNVWPLALAFGGLAILAAGILRRPAPVTAIATGTLGLMYVIDLVGKLSEPMRPLRAISAFRYYGSAIQDGLDASHMIGLTLVGAGLAAIGAVLLARRDLG